MRSLILVLLLLCSSQGAWAQYVILGPGFVDVPGTVIEVPNMPRIRDQKHMGICWGVAATVLAQKYYCDLQQIGDCANLPPEKEISVLDLMSWEKLDEEKAKEGWAKNDRKIRLGLDRGGGSPTKPLWNSQDSFSFKRESCFPLDQFYEKFGASKEALAITMSRLQLFFDTYKIQRGTGEFDYKRALTIQAQECTSCSAELVAARKLVFEMFPLDKPDAYYGQKISWGLTKSTLDHFMYEVLFAAGCKVIPMPSPTVHIFPADGQRASSQELTEKLKKMLRLGIPVGVGAVRSKADGINHIFVISGYKNVCGAERKNCHELIKAHNSWGENWQKSANGGWIRWDDILEALDTYADGSFKPATIFWITERDSLNIKLNDSIPVGTSAVIEPSSAEAEYSSWDNTTCTVSEKGVVTGVKPGGCIVTFSRGRKGYPLVTRVVAQ